MEIFEKVNQDNHDEMNIEQNDKFSAVINDLIDKMNKATTFDEKWKYQFMIEFLDCCSYNPETNKVKVNTNKKDVFYNKGIDDILDMIAFDRAIKNIELKDSLNDSVKYSVNDIIMNRIKSVYSIIKYKINKLF